MNQSYPNLGIALPDILLPNPSLDFQKWAVIACDQYTSEPDYWDDVRTTVGNSPSTYHITLPEIFLNNPDIDQRIEKINANMSHYLQTQTFTNYPSSMIYVEREQSTQKRQCGLILSVDLDQFDFSKTSRSLIRPTEGTIVDRIPPRLKIRANASVELPHILLLIDDPDKTVIEPIRKSLITEKPLYDFKLMKNQQSIKGYRLFQKNHIQPIISALTALISPEILQTKYESAIPFLFAVGDGNHSLATAKTHWENLKAHLSKNELTNHPARYALVEIVNLYDESLEFEAIHRILFHVDPNDCLQFMHNYYQNKNCEIHFIKEKSEIQTTDSDQIIQWVSTDASGYLVIQNPLHTLAVGTLQQCLDAYLTAHSEIEIDYIHGEKSVYDLSKEPNRIGFLLPAIEKTMLFKSIAINGPMPRKTFSMGEADDKRYYIEARKIIVS